MQSLKKFCHRMFFAWNIFNSENKNPGSRLLEHCSGLTEAYRVLCKPQNRIKPDCPHGGGLAIFIRGMTGRCEHDRFEFRFG